MSTTLRRLCRPDFFVELPTIRHYPQVEALDAVAEGYLRFLQQL